MAARSTPSSAHPDRATTAPAALVISFSDLERDPRVRRQVEWLAGDGWVVDTLGLGSHPAPEVRDHFALVDRPRWVRSRIGRLLNYGLLPAPSRFRNLELSRIPDAVRSRIAEGGYELVVFEDYDLLPMLSSRSVFTPAALQGRIHLDLHEYREPRLALNSIRMLLSHRYYRWRRGFIGHPAITTRTTVASRIADLYADDFGVPPPAVVRNCPPYVDLEPQPNDGRTVRLLFHGMASWARGWREILDALPELDERFTMTFMLNGSPAVIEQLRTAITPFGDRVGIIPPVPMSEVPHAVNGFDLELMFYQPTQANLEFALPNKFFEAVQGRIGVVVGRSPMMAEIVEQYGNGAIVDGWTAADLAATLNALTRDRVDEFKQAAHRAARDLNAENERAAFLAALEPTPAALG